MIAIDHNSQILRSSIHIGSSTIRICDVQIICNAIDFCSYLIVILTGSRIPVTMDLPDRQTVFCRRNCISVNCYRDSLQILCIIKRRVLFRRNCNIIADKYEVLIQDVINSSAGCGYD